MKKFYNKKSLIVELKRHGISRSYSSLYKDIKNGLLVGMGEMADGKRTIYLYDEETVKYYINKVHEMQKSGQARLRIKSK